MGFARIKGPLRSRIGCRVCFGSPKDVRERGGGVLSGEIIDEVWSDPGVGLTPPHSTPCDPGCWGDYSFCSQLIKWNDGNHSIRLAYYRRRCGQDFWEYASQMTVTSEVKAIKTLLERTLAKATWFQETPAPSAEQNISN